MRVDWKPGTLIYPLPAVLISCGSMEDGKANILTASWVSTVCTNPPMCVVGIRPERYSHDLIQQHGAFGINLSTVSMARETDWCGVVSGRKMDKFEACGFTKEAGSTLGVPLIEESPISLVWSAGCVRSPHWGVMISSSPRSWAYVPMSSILIPRREPST